MTPLRTLRLRFRFPASALALLVSCSLPAVTGCGAASKEIAAPPVMSAPAAMGPSSKSAMEPSADTAMAGAMPGAAAQAPTAPGIPGSDLKSTSAPNAATTPASPQKAKSGDGPKLDDAAKPLLIYEGAIVVQVKKDDFSGAIERAIDVAESFDGYLVSRTDTSVQLRVPSQKFRAAMKQLGELGQVTRRSVSAQDVSEEFHDLGVRLKNLESVRDRLEQFLSRATNVDEALRVGKELEAVVAQIDQIKGRMQFLKTRAAYSLISLSLEPKPEPVLVKSEDKHEPTPPPAPRPLRMPVSWLHKVGLDHLLDLGSEP